MNVSKLRSVSSVLHNCLAFQDSQYWFGEIPAIQQLILQMPTFSEEAAHAASLQLEPRVAAAAVEERPEANKGRKSSAAQTEVVTTSVAAKKGSVVNKFATMRDDEVRGEMLFFCDMVAHVACARIGLLASFWHCCAEKYLLMCVFSRQLPRLPTFPPPLTDKEDYKEYMQLRYEYKRRHIPLEGAVAFSNVSKTNEGGGFLRIKSELEEEDDSDPDREEEKEKEKEKDVAEEKKMFVATGPSAAAVERKSEARSAPSSPTLGEKTAQTVSENVAQKDNSKLAVPVTGGHRRAHSTDAGPPPTPMSLSP